MPKEKVFKTFSTQSMVAFSLISCSHILTHMVGSTWQRFLIAIFFQILNFAFMSWKDDLRIQLSPFALAAKVTFALLFSWPYVSNTTDFAPLSTTIVFEIISGHAAVSSIAIMQSKSKLFLCFNWRTYKIYGITLTIICSGVFCPWLVLTQIAIT